MTDAKTMLFKYAALSMGFLIIAITAPYSLKITPYEYLNNLSQLEKYLYYTLFLFLILYILFSIFLGFTSFRHREKWNDRNFRIFFWVSAAATGFSVPISWLFYSYSPLLFIILFIIEACNISILREAISIMKERSNRFPH